MTLKNEAEIRAAINSTAIRCFRDTGDDDYIAARIAYRAHLVRPFLWSALQAVEKYLKCALVLNRVSSIGLKHDIQRALDRFNAKAKFKITLSKPEQQIFEHLANYGPDRYLIYSYHIYELELPKLDLLVWHLRQYCRTLDYEMTLDNGVKMNMLQVHLNTIEANKNSHPKSGHLVNGRLEKVLKRKNVPAREGLIWKNLRYTTSKRTRLTFRSHSHFENAPLSMRPELLPHIQPYIQLSNADVMLYTEHWEKTNKKSTSKAPQR